MTDKFMNASGFPMHGENMMKTTCDEKGRVCLPPSISSKYGKDFIVVEMPSKLVLLPVPDDPVTDLQELGRPLRGMSLADIKRAIREQADKEIDETLDRLGLRRTRPEGQGAASPAGRPR